MALCASHNVTWTLKDFPMTILLYCPGTQKRAPLISLHIVSTHCFIYICKLYNKILIFGVPVSIKYWHAKYHNAVQCEWLSGLGWSLLVAAILRWAHERHHTDVVLLWSGRREDCLIANHAKYDIWLLTRSFCISSDFHDLHISGVTTVKCHQWVKGKSVKHDEASSLLSLALD